MSDKKEVQGEETPVTEPAQVEEKTLPVTEKENDTPKNEAVPQSEWQKAQEEIRNLKQIAERNDLEKFEFEHPIVKTEKYKAKWEEIQNLKKTPGHKYENLSHLELLNLIRDHTPQSEPKPKPTPVPSFNPSASPDTPSGEIDETVNNWLSMRYTKEEIEATKR